MADEANRSFFSPKKISLEKMINGYVRDNIRLKKINRQLLQEVTECNLRTNELRLENLKLKRINGDSETKLSSAEGKLSTFNDDNKANEMKLKRLLCQIDDYREKMLKLTVDKEEVLTELQKSARKITDLESILKIRDEDTLNQQKFNAMLVEERISKMVLTKKCNDLQEKVHKYQLKDNEQAANIEKDSEFLKIIKEEYEAKLKKLNNLLSKEKDDYQDFKSAQEAKYKRLLNQIDDYRSKILKLTTENESIRMELSKLHDQHLTGSRKIKRLQKNLRESEEKVADLESVLEVYQTELEADSFH